MPALDGCSPGFILAGFISSTHISDPLVHVLSPLLCFFSYCVWIGCMVPAARVSLHEQCLVHKVVIPVLFLHNNSA